MAENELIAKDAARTRALLLRDQLGKRRRAQFSRRICAHLARTLDWSQSQQIALFWPLPQEVDIRHFFAVSASARRSLFLPRVENRKQKLKMHNMLRSCLILRTGYGGISEPDADFSSSTTTRIDSVLVPATSVDRLGNRVGTGLGFYDITLQTMPAALVICPVFSCQLSEQIACEQHDVPVDLIVTEKGVLDLRSRRGR